MKRSEKGSVTLEACLALTAFMFFILTFLGFGKYWAAQNALKHALNQTAETMSIDNEARTTVKNTPLNLTDEIVEMLAARDESWASSLASIFSQPYTDIMIKDLRKTVWIDITYYMTGELMSNKDECVQKLSEHGIEITAIEFLDDGGNVLNDTDKVDDTFTLRVRYKINTGLSFFAVVRDLEFSDYAVVTLQ